MIRFSHIGYNSINNQVYWRKCLLHTIITLPKKDYSPKVIYRHISSCQSYRHDFCGKYYITVL